MMLMATGKPVLQKTAVRRIQDVILSVSIGLPARRVLRSLSEGCVAAFTLVGAGKLRVVWKIRLRKSVSRGQKNT